MDIMKMIEKKAKEKTVRILLVEGEDDRLVEAAKMAKKHKVCTPVLLRKISGEVKGIEAIGIEDNPDMEDYVKKLVELRKHKGLTEEKARELLKNPNYFGALLVKLGKVDGAVGGCKYSTADWMRAVFQVIGTKKDIPLVSAVCFFVMKDRTIFFSDTDFSIKPDAEQLAQIAINAADFVKGIGIEPKVALLSYSTKGNGEHEVLEPIRKALEIVKEKREDIIIDGEMQFDAAINPGAAEKKCPDSVLKGEANVLIFPDITVGNVLVHALVQVTDYKFYGSFPVGLAKPVMNGGRSFDAEQIYDLITACAMQVNI
ncbi:MAG: phosphate acetyltransferase [Nanoarchaeota archaeon]|nr:phosphate acetyltransferase [Nanoarchaeota archaeon]